MLAWRGELFLQVFSQEDSALEHVTAQVASASLRLHVRPSQPVTPLISTAPGRPPPYVPVCRSGCDCTPTAAGRRAS